MSTIGKMRLVAAIVAALAAGFVVWLLVIRDDGGSVPAAGARPVAASEDDLATLADTLGHPIYWAGELDGTEIELTRTDDDRVYVRYLVDGAEVGDPSPELLTIGTYPYENAQRTLERYADAKGALTSETPDGELVVTNESNPSSVYLADPGAELEIEVYDPDPKRAFTLATSGSVVPVQ